MADRAGDHPAQEAGLEALWISRCRRPSRAPPCASTRRSSPRPQRPAWARIAHEIWPNAGLPGELLQILPTTDHIEQASTLVTRDAVAESMATGRDVQAHLDAVTPYLEIGFDEVYVANTGPHWEQMLQAYGSEVLPELRARAARG